MTERKQISLQKDNTQAALEFALTRTNKRLEIFKEHNSGILEKDLMREFAQNEGVYWEDLEPIINAAKRQLDQCGDNISVGEQAALDTFPDGMNYQGQYVWDWFTKNSTTIRAALTAQLTKTDDNVSCPSVVNTGDINAELLEALKKEMWKFQTVKARNYANGYNDAIDAVLDILARAEQKGGE